MANPSNKELGNIKCINGKNFHMWKFQMCAIFMGKELLGIVDENDVEPTTIRIVQVDWKKRDNQMISYVPSTWQEVCVVCCCMLFGTRSMLSKRGF
jgi:hypothetical protein